MSKMFKVLLTICIISFITTGCSVKTESAETGESIVTVEADISQEEGIIKALAFDDSQEKVLRGIGAKLNDIFYFKYEGIPKEYNWLEVWIEYYENGVKISKLFSIHEGVSRNGNILCMFEDIDNKSKITIEGSSCLKDMPVMEQRVITNKKNVYPIVSNNDTEFLLAIRVVDSGNNSAIIPDEIFTKHGFDYKELLKNDYVYLVKGRFYSKSN